MRFQKSAVQGATSLVHQALAGLNSKGDFTSLQWWQPARRGEIRQQ